MKLEEQIHCIKPKNGGKIETVQLKDLFSEYNTEGLKQIIRFNSNVFNILENKLKQGDVNLFNKVNPNTNSKLIYNFNNKEKNLFDKALIIQIKPEIISGNSLPILIENSIKIVNILEMNDLFIEDIIKEKKYKYSINKSKSFEEFKKWFVEEFEKGRLSLKEFEQMSQLFYRKIKLINN